MYKETIKRIAAVTAAVVCIGLTSCGNSEDKTQSKASGSSSAADSVPSVTLPQDKETDSASQDESDTESKAEQENGENNKGEYAPAMWKVTSPDGETMYMMGSMHALTEDCYPLPDYVTNAFEQADILAVECDISDTTATFTASMKQMENMMYDDGTTLKDHLSEETYSNLDSYFTAHGEKLSLYDGYKPWYISSVVENMAVADAGLNSGLGIDMHLLNLAGDEGKEIYEVESIDFQLDMLVNFSDEIQDISLNTYSEENMEELNAQFTELFEAWRTGDIDKISELSDGDQSELTDEQKAAIDDYNKVMLYDRNIGMAQAAEQLMSEGKSVFYIVGAAHFVGDGGIIDLMENDGYTFELVTE